MDLSLPSSLLADACRIFLDLAYPGGPETIPEKKRVFYQLQADHSLEQVLPPGSPGVCEELKAAQGDVRGYALRLGSAAFPHLKLKVQLIDHENATVWVFTVDTHDSYSRASFYPPPDHPEAAAWRALQAANRALKEQIETALDRHGIPTFTGLLRRDLNKPSAS